MKVQDYLPYVTCAGVIGTALVSSKCTLEAEKILREKNLENAPIQEKAKETWKYYIPVVAVAGATIVSVLVTKRLNAKELAAVTAACGYLAQKGSAVTKELVDIARDKDGGKVQDIVNPKFEYSGGQTIEDTGNGKLLCIEGYSGRLFWSSEEAVRDAVQKFKDLFEQNRNVCLNDFYELLGIEKSHFGHQFGWVCDEDYSGTSGDDLDFEVETVMDKDRKVPICCIDIFNYPFEGWQEV